jgi:hypothetical protein
MEVNIEWGEPYRVKLGTVNHWRRTWCIPKEARPAFFQFWREEKFRWLTEGFRVYKEDDEWYLAETKVSPMQFKAIGITRKGPPPVSDFILPNYDISDESGLRPWQVVATGRLVSSIKEWGAAIDGSDMGTGKTYSACAAMRELGANIVVVCPKGIISTWGRVIKDHFNMGNKLVDIVNYEQLRIGKSSSKIASFVLPRGAKRKQFQWKVNKNNTIILWDECHRLKNWKTKTAKTCVAAYQQGFRQLFLSATTATTPLELRAIGMSLKLFRGGQQNWYQWIKEHGCNKGIWGGMEFTEEPKLRKKILKKLHKEIFLDRGVRLRRDSIPNFPDCDLFAVLLDMEKEDTDRINSIYDEMDKELKALEKLQKLNNRNRLVIELRYRQRIELVKVPLFIDMIEEAKEEGFSIVVFVNFTETINALSKRLGVKCIFDGKTKDSVRDENVKRFQDNEEPVIFLNVQSGGSCLSLHDLHGGHPRLA